MWGDNYLAHYGIMGMKWGVRRYKSESGALTEAGKVHYGKVARESDKRLTSRIKDDEDYDGYGRLSKEITEKSGDWYNSTGVSAAFKKALAENETAKEVIRLRHDSNAAYKAASARHREVLKQYHPEDKVTDDKKFNQAFDKAEKDPLYQELYKKYHDISKKQRAAMRAHTKRYMDQVAGIVLDDLGYENTARGRKFILDNGVVFWD